MTEIVKPPRRIFFVSVRVKLILAFTILFSVIFAGTYYWFYTSSIDRALSRVTEDLDVTLTGTAAKINGDDFEKLATTVKPNADGYSTDPLYLQHVQWLYTVSQLDPRARLYTFILGSSVHEVIFIGSSGALSNPPRGATLQEACTDAPDDCGDLTANVAALQPNPNVTQTSIYTVQTLPAGTVVNQSGIYSDSFGNWISGYTPIKNSSGKIVGALGVDFTADYVEQVQSSIVNSVAIAFVLTYIILFITVWVISRTFSEPILRLTRIAERIGEGDYNQDVTRVPTIVPVRDEIDTLADVFKIMIGKVAKREETLKQQVADLQIQIDHSKRDEQVKEIVENDFFQALQTKAYEMRTRRQQPQEPEPQEPKT